MLKGTKSLEMDSVTPALNEPSPQGLRSWAADRRAPQEVLVVKNLPANAGDVRDMGSRACTHTHTHTADRSWTAHKHTHTTGAGTTRPLLRYRADRRRTVRPRPKRCCTFCSDSGFCCQSQAKVLRRGDLASVRKRHCSPRCQGSSCVLKGLCSLLSHTALSLLRWQTPGRHSPSQTLVPFSTKSGGAIRHHCQTALGIYLQEHSKSPNQSVIMVIPI